MEFEKAKKIAAKLISFKMYTCNEITQKLTQKEISRDVAEMVVGEFCKAGILDDLEYAKAYIHDGIYVHLKGMYRIKQELIKKGVASSVIERAMQETEVDADDSLTEYVRLRFGDREFSDRTELEKAKAHLVRRGFAISDINKCFDNLGIKLKRSDTD